MQQQQTRMLPCSPGPGPTVEREVAQATGQAETVGRTDPKAFHQVMSVRENRYLARHLCWVLTILAACGRVAPAASEEQYSRVFERTIVRMLPDGTEDVKIFRVTRERPLGVRSGRSG
jgi:hypothetical protein